MASGIFCNLFWSLWRCLWVSLNIYKSKDQRPLEWFQCQLIFSFHTLLPTSNSSHISFLLPLYTQLQVWRSRKIISTSTLLRQKIISVLGGEYLPLSSARLCCGFQQCPCGSNAKLEQCAILTRILGPLTTPHGYLLVKISTYELQWFWHEIMFHTILLSLLIWNWTISKDLKS